MNARAWIGAAATALLLVGCARTVDGSPASTFPTTVDSLAAKIQSGAKALQSAHITMHITLGPQTVAARGDEQLSGGKATALALDERIPQFGTIRVVRVDEKTYVRLPASHRTSDKPWALVRSGSSNPVVSALAGSLASTNQLTQLDAVGAFVRAAKHLRFVGTDTIDGATVGHYTLTIDVDKLPADFPQKQTLQSIGLSDLPLDLWVDTNGNARKVTEDLAVLGQRISVRVLLSNLDAPVHITAPPASQVDTS